MIVNPDFFEHWKTQMLVDLSKNDASPLWILRLWAFAQQRKTGTLNIPSKALKSIAKAKCTEDDLIDWLETCGFIIRNDLGITLWQWEEYNIGLFSAWENGKKGGRPRITHGIPTGNQQVTHGKPDDNPRQTQSKPIRVDKIGLDKIGEDKNKEIAERIWQAYPKKVAKSEGMKAILKAIKRNEIDTDKMLKATEVFAESRKDQDEKFTAFPSTWFNQSRFNDFVPEPPQPMLRPEWNSEESSIITSDINGWTKDGMQELFWKGFTSDQKEKLKAVISFESYDYLESKCNGK